MRNLHGWYSLCSLLFTTIGWHYPLSQNRQIAPGQQTPLDANDAKCQVCGATHFCWRWTGGLVRARMCAVKFQLKKTCWYFSPRIMYSPTRLMQSFQGKGGFTTSRYGNQGLLQCLKEQSKQSCMLHATPPIAFNFLIQFHWIWIGSMVPSSEIKRLLLIWAAFFVSCESKLLNMDCIQSQTNFRILRGQESHLNTVYTRVRAAPRA